MADILCAIRTQAAWDAMTAGEQAVYANHYTDLTTAIAAITAVGDLVANTQNWILKGFNDWPAGLTDSITIPAALVTDTSNGVHISPATGHEISETGNGTDGFHLSKSLDYAAIIQNDSSFCSVKSVGIINTGTTSSRAYMETAGNNVIAGNYLKDSNTVSNINSAYCVDNIFDSSTFINNIVVSYQAVSFKDYTATKKGFNNTIINPGGAPGITYGIMSKAGSIVDIRNNIIYGYDNCIVDSDGTAVGSNNAGSETTVSTLGLGTITNLTATDFNDFANGDYRISSGSQLETYDGFDTLADVPTFFDGTARALPMRIGALSLLTPPVTLDPVSKVYISGLVAGTV